MRRYFTASTIACALCGAWWLIALIVPAHAAEKDRTFHWDPTRPKAAYCADPTVLGQLQIEWKHEKLPSDAPMEQVLGSWTYKLLQLGHCMGLAPPQGTVDNYRWRFIRTEMVEGFQMTTRVVLMRYEPQPDTKPYVAKAYEQQEAKDGGLWFLPDDLIDDAGHHPGELK